MTPAATTPMHAGAGGRLVLVESATPRLMVAQRGPRLPRGVHEIAPVLVVAAGPRGHGRGLPQGARAVAGYGRAALGLGWFSSSPPVPPAAPTGGFCAGGGTTRGIGPTGAPRARPGVVAAAAAGLGGAGSSTSAGQLCHQFGSPAKPSARGAPIGVAGPTSGESRPARSYVAHALDLGDDGGGEEDPSDEVTYQQAHRQMRAAVYLVCLRSRVEVASDLGLLPSGRERRVLLDVIGDINPAEPMYHWVVDRCHKRFGAILGADLYKDVIAVTPKEEGFEWIVRTDSDIIVNITKLMVEIQYSIMHNETWRAVVRDHPLYDMCPLFLNKLAGSIAQFSINLDLACFKRPFPPVIQRMAENHALAVVHLYEILLDFYEVLSSGQQAADPKKTKELLMRYDFLFVQDLDPQDYISGAGAADAEDLQFLLEALKPEVRGFRGTWM